MTNLTDKLEQPQQEPVAWMSDDDIDRICDELSLGARGRASFRAGLRYARDIARQAHSRTTEPIAWWNPVNDVALCKSEIERRNGDKGACSIPLYSRPTDLLMTARTPQVSSSATPKEMKELVRAGNAMRNLMQHVPVGMGSAGAARDWDAATDIPDFKNMPTEQVNDYLRSEGIDPDEEREYGRKVIERLKRAAALPKDTGDTKGGRLTKAAQP